MKLLNELELQRAESARGKRPPSLAIRFLKAGHTDFVDNPGSCFPCLFCSGSLAPKVQSRDLALKYVTAYFQWTLLGQSEAASYLTGAEAQKDVAAGNVAVQKS